MNSELDDDPTQWTLIEAARAVRGGMISSVDLTSICLARIDALQPELNAFIAVHHDSALATARAADLQRQSGRPCGPLHGVPLAHKDMFQRVGAITAGGSKILAQQIGSHTSPLLKRLDDNGAIDLGRLNMAEFAMGPTGHNAHYGRACNPVRPDLIAGGSSSGSGVAVGARMVFGALGSDTGGSIRLPAALCGVAGLKPTQGRLSMSHALPLSVSMDCPGPLARSVADLALLFDVLADPLPDALTDTARLDAAAASPPSLRGWRIGVADAYLVDVEADVAAALDSSRRLLTKLGAHCVRVELPDVDLLCELANAVSMFEAADVHRETLVTRADDYGPQVLARLRNGSSISKEAYARALADRPHWQRALLAIFENCDVIHMPVMMRAPPTATSVEIDQGPGLATMITELTRYTRPISYLGFPALVQPVGFTQDGLPLAMQLVGPPLKEARLLAIGSAFERARRDFL